MIDKLFIIGGSLLTLGYWQMGLYEWAALSASGVLLLLVWDFDDK